VPLRKESPKVGLRPTNNDVAYARLERPKSLVVPGLPIGGFFFSIGGAFVFSTPLRVFVRWLLPSQEIWDRLPRAASRRSPLPRRHGFRKLLQKLFHPDRRSPQLPESDRHEHRGLDPAILSLCVVGLTNAEAAEVLGISEGSAKHYWIHARTWLYQEITAAREK
jgi:hypothetical protein